MTGLLSASPKQTSQMTVVSSGEEEQDEDGAVAESLSEQHCCLPYSREISLLGGVCEGSEDQAQSLPPSCLTSEPHP